MASTSTAATTEAHGLTASQLSNLYDAVQTLDSHLLRCVHALRKGQWTQQVGTKDVADSRVRELLVKIGHCIQVKPVTNAYKIARNEVLTRRVRATMRAFNKNRTYSTTNPPNIAWDETFIPPNLYEDLESQLASLPDDGELRKDEERAEQHRVNKERAEEEKVEKERTEKERAEKERAEKERVEKERAERERLEKERAEKEQAANRRVENSRKGKEREQADPMPVDPQTAVQETPVSAKLNKKRPRKVQKSKAVVDDSGSDVNKTTTDQAESAEPQTKRTRRQKTAEAAIPDTIPPPCRRCTISQIHCQPNGYRAACKTCQKAKQVCSHSKLEPPKSLETVHDAPLPAKMTPTVAPAAPGSPNIKIVVRPRADPIRQRVSPATVQEPLNTMGETELQVMRKRLDDQDKRVRELQAAETVLRQKLDEQERTLRELELVEMKGERPFASIRYVDECVADVKSEAERNEQFFSTELDRLKTSIAKERTARHQVALQLEDETARIDTIMQNADMEDSRRDREMREAEQRWHEEMEGMERRLDERMDEHEARPQERSEGHGVSKEYVDRTLQESLERLELVGLKDSWSRELERRDRERRQEWEMALEQRPTHEQLAASYTALNTTQLIVDRLTDFQAGTDRQHHRLQAGLSTVERLYLRQLDAMASMTDDVPGQLEALLDDQTTKELGTSAEVGSRIMKGLPRKGRVVSGPAAMQQADVEMGDASKKEDVNSCGQHESRSRSATAQPARASTAQPSTPPPAFTAAPPSPSTPPPPLPPSLTRVPSPHFRQTRSRSRMQSEQPITVVPSVVPSVASIVPAVSIVNPLAPVVEGPEEGEIASSPLTAPPESPEKRPPDSFSRYIDFDMAA